MWTAIVLCLLAWVVFGAIGQVVMVASVAGERRGGQAIGVLLLITAFLSFVSACSLGVWKLVSYINN